MRVVIWCAVSSKPQAKDDKISLSYQEELAVTWCKEHDAELVATLKVPGYSRRESDVITAMDDFAKQGITAYQDLRDLWQRKAFDVLIAYSHDRLGRSNTLHSFVVENVILSGAQIYLIADGGYVDAQDFRYKLAIGGMLVAAPIDQFIQKSKKAKERLIATGLPVGPHVPISHVRLRDPITGKDTGFAVNEDLRLLWTDLQSALLEGIGWLNLGRELYQRYGHVDITGRAYSGGTLYYLVHNPLFWGHMAMRWTGSAFIGDKRWVFDTQFEAPAGVVIARDIVPSVYTGHDRDIVISELHRRIEARGRSYPSQTYRFKGLVVCGLCGRSMSVHVSHGRRVGLRCTGRSADRSRSQRCSYRFVRHEDIQAYFEKLINNALQLGSLEIQHSEVAKVQSTASALGLELSTAEAQLKTLIHELSLAPDSVKEAYRQQIADVGKRLDILRARAKEVSRQVRKDNQRKHEQSNALESIRQSGYGFWQEDDRTINQQLRRLFGNIRVTAIPGDSIFDLIDL